MWPPLNGKNRLGRINRVVVRLGSTIKKNFWAAHLTFQTIPVFTEKKSGRKRKYKERYSALYFACNCACDNWQDSQLTMFTKQIFIEFSVGFIQVFLRSVLLRWFFLFFLSISQRLSHINIINFISSYFRFIFFLCVVIGCILKPVNQVLPLWFLFNCQTFPSNKRSSADPI